jgi:hypothetical protein
MGKEDLEQAASYVKEGSSQRERAQALSASTKPADKAEAARLDRLADRNSEHALGAIRRDLGQDNAL